MKKVWLMVIVTILTSITCTIAFLKIPPTMVLIMEAFGVSLTVVGLTMTVATIAQVTVSLPFGIVAAKIDPKKSMYIVLLLGFLGGVIGALSANYNILLVGRILDGACFGMASIVGPQIITMLFPPEKRGLPMGIFSIWVPLGMLTIFNLANPIAEAYSWRGVWWFSSIVIIALAIIFILVFRSPPNANGEGSSQSMVQAEQGYKSFILTAFKSRAIWNIAFSFFFFSFLYAVLNNYYSTYLVQEVGLELGTANKIYTFSIIGMAIGGIITGTILNKVNRNNHAVLLTISLVLIAFCAFFQFQVKSPSLLIPFLLIAGFIYMSSFPIVFTLGSSFAKRPEEVGPIMGIINFSNGVAGVISPLVVGPLVAAFGGWSGLSVPLSLIAVLAVIGSLVFQKNYKQKLAIANEISQ